MKLIIAVVQDQDVPALMNKLLEEGYRATKLASTGGFLRVGNTTLLIGVDDNQVDEVVEIVRSMCKTRSQLVTPMTPMARPTGTYIPGPIEVPVGGGTIFVLDVVKFEKV